MHSVCEHCVPIDIRHVRHFKTWLRKRDPNSPFLELLSDEILAERGLVTGRDVKQTYITRQTYPRAHAEFSKVWAEYVAEKNGRPNKKARGNCIECGVEIWWRSVRCRSCHADVVNATKSPEERHRRALLNAERRREDKLLADMMREELTRRGVDVDLTIQLLRTRASKHT